MKSPFPGMDPYIEACGLWRDFHRHFIEAIYQHIADTVPERYIVQTDERYYIVLAGIDGKNVHDFYPDVDIAAPAEPRRPKKRGGSVVAEADAPAETTVMRAFIPEEFREGFIEVYESTPEKRLVTSIEVLSPTNKRIGVKGRDLYLRKRHAQMLQGVNLVEIDFLRGGEKMPMLDEWPTTPYTVMVARAHGIQTCRVWSAHFRRRLPTIPVPLARPDPDISLDLQKPFDTVYKRGRYRAVLDYTRPLAPALTPEDTVWLQERLRAR